MSAPPVQPIVIWFGRVGDMILLSALLDILHRRYGAPCHVIGAGSWPAQIYAGHRGRGAGLVPAPLYGVSLRRGVVAHTRAAARCAARAGVRVRVRSAQARPHRAAAALQRRRLPHCLFLAREPSRHEAHQVDRLVSFGRLTPPAFSAADYPWPAPPPRCAPHLEVGAAARAECTAWLAAQGWAGKPLVLVQPGNRRTMRGSKLRLSASDDKAWPIERWAAAAACRARTHAAGADPAVRRATRDTAALMDRERDAAAGGGGRGAAAAAAAGAVHAGAQHDLGRHRAGARGRRTVAAAGGDVRRARAAGVAAAQSGGLRRGRRRRPAAGDAPRPDSAWRRCSRRGARWRCALPPARAAGGRRLAG